MAKRTDPWGPSGGGKREIEIWEVAKLKPFAKNARQHSPAQIEQLCASIEEFGFTFPILIDEKGTILAGHGRVLAAQKRGQTHVPAIVARGWPEDRKRAYVIADNRLAEISTWDKKLLGSEIGALQLSGFDISLLGFTDDEIKALIATGLPVRVDPETAPPKPAEPVTLPGDLWLLGEHRLICGDATQRAHVDRVLGGKKPHLMVTDPPYGVDYKPEWRNKVLKASNRAEGKVTNDARADWREAWDLFPGIVAYIWHSGRHGTELGVSLTAAQFAIRSQIVWIKSNFAIGRGDYHWGHETAFFVLKRGTDPEEDHWRFLEEHECATYAVKLGSTSHWRGGRKQSTVWHIDMVRNETGHATQKPIECMRRPIVNNSKGGDCVYDPFLGSGTTLIACQLEGRICLGLEIDPGYCDVIIERWQDVTGQFAKLESNGKRFAVVKEERHAEETGKRKRKTKAA